MLAQTFQNFELLVINDGVTSIENYADRRLRVHSSNLAGAVPARNLGLAHAKGDAILWLDDDDVWTDRQFLERCVASLNGGSKFIFGDGALVFPDGARKPFCKDANIETLQRDNTILISAVCYCRDLHLALGAFDTSLPYYWDWDWYLRVARAGHAMTHLETPVVDIRIHTQNMSGNENISARQTNLQLLCSKHHLPPLPLKSHVDFV